jgi:AsmA protein
MVQGSWDDPIILPDPQSRILHSGAAQPILDAVRNRSLPDPVRSAIERLTGAAPQQPTAAPALAGSSTPAGTQTPGTGGVAPAQESR